VLWTDYFKAPHFEKYPNLHQLFNEATKLAGAGGAKGTVDVAVADQLLAKIAKLVSSNLRTEDSIGRATETTFIVMSGGPGAVQVMALARRNTARLLASGAHEVGANHYLLIVAVHVAWIASLWLTVPASAPRTSMPSSPTRRTCGSSTR